MKLKSILCMISLLISMVLFSQVQTDMKSPVNVCYVEVNNNNLLNIGSYTLKDSGKPLFDIGIIFAANIYYDASIKRAYLYSNSNVAKVLNNAETYIRPLQKKGIKVLLDVLGHHQPAGIGNFPSREAARDFAVQIANTVEIYGLDGVDFDDEYVKYPTTGEGKMNDYSFIFLLDELRQLLPKEKLITFYAYNGEGVYKYKKLEYDGHKAGEYINYAWNGEYGYFTIPEIPGMDKNRLAGAAAKVDFITTSEVEEMANDTKDEGCGVYMFYDLKGNLNKSRYFSAASKILYNEETALTESLHQWINADSEGCPTIIGLQVSKIKGTGATLNWLDSGSQAYTLSYREVGTTDWIELATNYKGSSYTIEDQLSLNKEYEWSIQSICNEGKNKSAYFFGPRFNSGNGCELPSGLKSSDFLGITTKLSWESSNATTYELQYKKSTDKDWIVVKDISNNSYQLKGLTSNTTYQWQVKSICNDENTSPYTDIFTFNSGFEKVNSPGPRSIAFQDSYLDAGLMNLSGDALTFEGWIKIKNFNLAPYYAPISSVIGIESGDSNSALLRFGDGGLANNKLQFVLSIDGKQIKLNSTTSFSTNEWYHIAATYDGIKMRIYVNGLLDAETNQKGGLTANGILYMGTNDGSGRFLNAYFDEFRIWSKALSLEDISNHRCNVAPNADGLVANWKMNEGSGGAALDETSNSHFALIKGNASWSTDVPTVCKNTLGTDENKLSNKDVVVYPNPIKKNQELNIHMDNLSGGAEVSFYDLSGRIFKKVDISSSETKVNLHIIASGMYIYKITSKKDQKVMYTGKLIVQ